MSKYHNPSISNEIPKLWKATKKNIYTENVIKRLHFLWIGSPINSSNSKHVKDWVVENIECKDYNIYVWYDSIFLNSDQEKEMLDYIISLSGDESRVFLCDIRKYPIFDEYFKPLIEIYEYEVGLNVRPGMKDYTRKIRNWGMGTDILRLIILYLYGGFYFDVDLFSKKMCDDSIFNTQTLKEGNKTFNFITCLGNFCINSFEEEEEGSTVSNNAIYYNPQGKNFFNKTTNTEIMGFLLKNIVSDYRILMDNYYHYLLFDYRQDTLLLTGPGLLRDQLEFQVINFPEDFQGSSWTIKDEHYPILVELLYDLFDETNGVFASNMILSVYDRVKISLEESKIMINILEKLIDLHPDEALTKDTIKTHFNSLPSEMFDGLDDELISLLFHKLLKDGVGYKSFYEKYTDRMLLIKHFIYLVTNNGLNAHMDYSESKLGEQLYKILESKYDNDNLPKLDFFERLISIQLKSVKENTQLTDEDVFPTQSSGYCLIQ
jgi:hypothetical protein